MRDIDKGDAQFPVHVLELELHFLAHLEVQRSERLVEEQDLGLIDQRAGDGDSLLLAAGERAHAPLFEAFQIHQVQGSPDLALDHVLGRLLLPEAERDVVVDIHVREQSVPLEDSIDGPLIRRQVLDRFPVEQDLTLRRHREACDHSERRCLAAAGRPQQGHEFAALDFQIEIIHCFVAVFVYFGDPAQFDDICIVIHSLGLRSLIFFTVLFF